MITYKEFLKKFNRTLHLTSKNANLEQLIEQSIYIEKFIRLNSVVMDVGSGGGIVGIPLKIVRKDLVIYLIERSERKSLFLDMTIKHLNLENIFVLNKDYRDLDFDFKFDFIISRALGNYENMVRYLKKFLRDDGCFIIFSDVNLKGFEIRRINYGNLAISLLAFSKSSSVSIEIPS